MTVEYDVLLLVEKALLFRQYSEPINGIFRLLSEGFILTKAIADSLILLLNRFCSDLIASKHEKKADWIWERAIELSKSRNPKIMHSFSSYLLHRGCTYKSADFLRKCFELHPHYFMAMESLENIKSLVVDRWHFRMLNDKIRNNSYRVAIEREISLNPGCIVLDIGGGTGLLSIYAAMAGASHVYCCEVSPSLSHLANLIIADHNLTHKITVITKHSTHLQIGDNKDIPKNVDLIVTELVDSGLLGEHIIPVLRDAQRRLLRPGGTMIPHSATIYGVPIQSESILRRQRLLTDVNKINFPHTHRLMAHLQHDSPIRFQLDEGYTCDSLQELRHQPLSQPLPLSEIVFQSQADNTSQRVIGNHVNDIINYPSSVTSFEVTKDGQVDGFAMWFTLYLTPPLPTNTSNIYNYHHDNCNINNNNEVNSQTPTSATTGSSQRHIPSPPFPPFTSSSSDNSIDPWYQNLTHSGSSGSSTCIAVSTSPGRPDCGWDQALLFRNYSIDTNTAITPSAFRVGEVVTTTITHSDSNIMVELARPLDQKKIDQSPFPPPPPHSIFFGNLTNNNQESEDDDDEEVVEDGIIEIGEMDMALLNDSYTTELFLRAILSTIDAVSESGNSFSVIELGATWLPYSISALLAAPDLPVQNLTLNNSNNSNTNDIDKCRYSTASSPYLQQVEVFCEGKEQSDVAQRILHSWKGLMNNDNKYNIAFGKYEESCTNKQLALPLPSLPENTGVSTNNNNHNHSSFSDHHNHIVVCNLIEGSGLLKQGILEDLRFTLQTLSNNRCTENPLSSSPPPPHSTASTRCSQPMDVASLEVSEDTSKESIDFMHTRLRANTSTVSTIPYSLGVVLAPVECPSLHQHHIVSSEVTGESFIPDRINEFGASVLRELNLSGLSSLKYLSAPREVMSFPLRDLIHHHDDYDSDPRSTAATATDSAAAAADTATSSSSSFMSTVTVDIEIEDEEEECLSQSHLPGSATSSRTIHAIAMWYRLVMAEGGTEEDILDTGPNALLSETSSKYSSSHWRQAAFLLQPPIDVQQLPSKVLTIQIDVDLSTGIWCKVLKI